LPTGSPQEIDFDVAGLFSQFLAWDYVSLPGVQGAQQGHREAARRAQPGARRDIRHAHDFEIRMGTDVHQAQGFAHDGVLHFVHRMRQLHLRVLDEQLLREGLVQRDVDVLIDGRRDDETGVVAVIGRQVRAAAAERNAERTAGDDHAAFSRYTCSAMRRAACASAMPGRG
jgi:hypothetical protein